MSNDEHWNRIYEGRPTEELGWYEPEPSTLELVTAHSTPDDSVIDLGGGDSRLVDALLARGYDVDSLPAAFAPDFEPVTVGPIAPSGSADGDRRPYVGAVLTRVDR